MAANQDTMAMRGATLETAAPACAPTVSSARGATAPGETAVGVVAETLARLPRQRAAAVACAPGRLEILGGSAEYTGGLVLTMPAGGCVCVATERRDDGQLRLVGAPAGGGAARATHCWPLSALYQAEGVPLEAERAGTLLPADGGNTVCCVLGTLIELVRARVTEHLDRGLTLAVGSELEGLSDVGAPGAMAAAVTTAVAGAFGRRPDPMTAAAVAERVERAWLRRVGGPAEAFTALVGEPATLMQFRCRPPQVAGTTHLPDDVLLVGLDTGSAAADVELKQRRVRTAACMGAHLIGRILAHGGGRRPASDHCLARVSINDYIEHYRNRLPTKLPGREFLERFGETDDGLTRVEPDVIYKVRSRTEHHIYENARAHQFVECLRRAIRLDDPAALAQAGEVLYGSHWSYGQRCGLGSVTTDRLVTLLRQYGENADIYGARISGHGCGGVVVVLLRTTERAQAALRAALTAFERKTGRAPRVIGGATTGGALLSGVTVVEPPGRG
ncbi:MAG TPA: hypothetical protein PKK06_10445 [Phycisphaerae bacterium]|nr:hypothetical protein [Phycisphaerae bacterium]HNU45782.1 hypothetical protein [Phycisphaerae bacterium]